MVIEHTIHYLLSDHYPILSDDVLRVLTNTLHGVTTALGTDSDPMVKCDSRTLKK